MTLVAIPCKCLLIVLEQLVDVFSQSQVCGGLRQLIIKVEFIDWLQVE